MARPIVCPEDMKEGVVHNSRHGSFRVVKYNKASDVVIEFIATGYVRSARLGAIRSGSVVDVYHPTCYGVGFIGEGEYPVKVDGVKTPHYASWHHMLERCYSDKYQLNKPTYIGCSVTTHWLNFQNFAEWFDAHYEEGCHLDKDGLVQGNKVYGPDTCQFISPAKNTIISRASSTTLLSPDGVEVFVFNVSEFCRDNNLSQGNMAAVIRGERPHHKGWTLPARR